MAISVTFFVLAIVIIAIWLIIEVKRMKHKIFAILLIGLILLTYFSFAIALKNQDLDLTSISGITHAGEIYLSWLSSMFTNIKSITAYALKQNWSQYNEKIINSSLTPKFLETKEKHTSTEEVSRIK